MTKIIFAMYNPETNCIEVSLDDKIHVSFGCQKCNASVCLDEPSDIAYLTRLAREKPGLYAKLAARDGGLQGYVEALGEFNWGFPHLIQEYLYTFLFILHKKAYILAICAMVYKVTNNDKHSLMGENHVISGSMHVCFQSERFTK